MDIGVVMVENDHDLEENEGDQLDYEVLAERKRKALSNNQIDGSVKKSKVVEDALFTSIDEIIGSKKGRRKSKQFKKRGRRQGSKTNLTPEVRMKLGEANVYYAKRQHEDAIHVLEEVITLAPNLSEAYHTLGLVYEEIGNKKKCMSFYWIAVKIAPKEHPFLWKRLFVLFLEQGYTGLATDCLEKAIKVDPEDMSLRYNLGAIYFELSNYKKAADLYYHIVERDTDNVEACLMAAKSYQKCNQVELSVRILEEYIKNHSSIDDFSVTSLLVCIHMEHNAHCKALEQIEHARLACGSQKQLPIHITVKAGICQVHMGNIEEALIHFSCLDTECAEDVAELVIEVADKLMSCKRYKLALNYYYMLEGNTKYGNGMIPLRIAKCYMYLTERSQAVVFFYKALRKMEDNIDIRVTLASLLLEEGNEDEAIKLLSPPTNLEPKNDTSSVQCMPWWDSGKVKKQLAEIYFAKGMVEEFVETILPSISETLRVEYLNLKFRPRNKLPKSTLIERVKMLEDHQVEFIFHGKRPLLAAPLDRLKAMRAKKSLQKIQALKEEKRAAALASGQGEHIDDDSDEESPQTLREPPLLNLLEDNDHYQLILDLCKALASLQRYREALTIIKDAWKLTSSTLSLEKKEELESLEAHIAYNTPDSTDAYAQACATVLKDPKSIAAWNSYYKIRMENKSHSRSRFLNLMMRKDPECVPPLIISGHQFTLISQHQEAARKYLEAYKLQPDSPLVNLCVGTALINLALGLRVRNKHQCLAQGFAFLHNILRLCGDSQEALYNVARAYQHVGLVTLAAWYYEKVLATHEEDYLIPKLPTENTGLSGVQTLGYCNLRREAAHNLHLIYMISGASDLARQVLRCHCTV
ncbi:General transcription factor 3c polypeptide [Thalictrum thalictroides]|uniref:General transcription factor 3c polypeptide n=1 Tax=Thalictrum thalictroides TaxID=46969 RepID=A0A7J6XAF3_THATH|nr:General transcription factor 3c polypeptide [Thalictrum thalictroides]